MIESATPPSRAPSGNARNDEAEAGPRSLAPLFRPKSVAVVGASPSEEKAGHQMLQTLRGFPGDLAAVHPREAAILGVPAYPSLAGVPHAVDLAVLAVPPQGVPAVLNDAASAGVKAAVICAGGFAESGPEGERLEAEVRGIAGDAGIRILGPNTSGFANPNHQLHAVFLPTAKALKPGSLAIVAQSGGVNLALSFMALEADIGLSLAVGLGNAVDVGFVDVLQYLGEDPATEVICLHIEGTAQGELLCQAIEQVSPRKPVVALKIGRSDVGQLAQSHTGALMGDWGLTRSALAQSGAVIVDSTTEMIDACRALSFGRVPPREEPGVGVISAQAGPALLIADELRSSGVAIPTLAEGTIRKLGESLPPLTYQQNPVDTGRPGSSFPDVLKTVAGDPAIDALLVYALHEPAAVDLGRSLGATAGVESPVLCGTGGRSEDIAGLKATAESNGVPVYGSPERAASAMRALVADSRGQHRLLSQEPPRLPAGPVMERGDAFTEDESKSLLGSWGITTPQRLACATRADAQAALTELGSPVVVKILDSEVTHKSDVGGVHLGIRTPVEMDGALDAIDAIGEGHEYLVERMVPPGPELIIGGKRDPSFGPVVLLGVGGVAAEALRLSVVRRAPLSTVDARQMLVELPAGSLLDGYRGQPAADRDQVAEWLCRVGDLLTAHDWLLELDLNPVRVTSQGLVALDALLVPSG